MTRFRFLLILGLCLFSSRLYAGDLLSYRDSLKNGYNFLLYIPDDYEQRKESDDPLPVIVCLHGKSRVGNDLKMVTKYGCVDALRRGAQIDAIVICPQCNTTGGWKAQRVMNVVDFVYERYKCDPDRLYVYGMSMGGWGAFKMVAEYPDRVAAAIAMCGGYIGDNYENIGKVPLWIIHGTADEVTTLSHSTRIVKKLEEIGQTGRVRCTWLESEGHSILARIFLLEDTYKWLFQHRLSTPDRPCSQEYEVTKKDLKRAYIYLDPEKRQKLPITKP
ncbi:MAG: prolyl oligopeptidase family serine peptidase [Bacteroidales bacterium]|nr:prolyl oligopeptidase family serine peptidase [Bacteroidales bacterium]